MLVSELETPCLVLDLDRLDANIAQAAQVLRTAGKEWRPHAKGHKSTAIAWKLMQAGAIGMTVAKVSEAEVFARAGITDLLLAHLPVGASRCERIANLARHCRLIVTVDHYAQAEPLAAACRRAGSTIRILIDVNVGMNRTGIRPGRDAFDLATAVAKLEGLQLVGVMGYEGHLFQIANAEEKQQKILSAMSLLELSRDQFLKSGLCCDIVSAGGTGSLFQTVNCPSVTESQAGNVIFGDPYYAVKCHVSGFPPTLTVRATVVSRPSLERGVLDAGRKSVGFDFLPPSLAPFPNSRLVFLSAEHATFELCAAGQSLRIGDVVAMQVGYSDFTIVLHEQFHVVRNNIIEAVWPTDTRGCIV